MTRLQLFKKPAKLYVPKSELPPNLMDKRFGNRCSCRCFVQGMEFEEEEKEGKKGGQCSESTSEVSNLLRIEKAAGLLGHPQHVKALGQR